MASVESPKTPDQAPVQKRCPLRGLPEEILQPIITLIHENSTSRKDGGPYANLAPLSLTCKHLRSRCMPDLYEKITLRGETHEVANKVASGMKSQNVRDFLVHTKTLNIHFRDPGFTPKSQPLLESLTSDRLEAVAIKQRDKFFHALESILNQTTNVETLSFDLYTNRQLDTLQQTRQCLDLGVLRLVDFRDKLPKLKLLKTYQARPARDRDPRSGGLDIRKSLLQIFGKGIETLHIAGPPFIGSSNPLLTDWITKPEKLHELRLETFWEVNMVQSIAQSRSNLTSLGLAGWYSSQKPWEERADELHNFLPALRSLPQLEKLELPRLCHEMQGALAERGGAPTSSEVRLLAIQISIQDGTALAFQNPGVKRLRTRFCRLIICEIFANTYSDRKRSPFTTAETTPAGLNYVIKSIWKQTLHSKVYQSSKVRQ
ncbi:MAG: hypothetical protein Q9162_006783 [Coniocarpon cinnabarinum]